MSGVNERERIDSRHIHALSQLHNLNKSSGGAGASPSAVSPWTGH